MQIEGVIAAILLICLLSFFIVNMYNVLRFRRGKSTKKIHVEVQHPSSFLLGLAAFGTMTYAVEVLLYLIFALSDSVSILRDFPLNIKDIYTFNLQIFGIVLSLMGYMLSIWSVIVRGKYAVSWEMPENHKIVKNGPYKYVRHPSYLGYFLMFFGLFFLWPCLFTLLPFVAIPGYFLITFDEEKLLVNRFGKDYEEYRKRTGRFIPKFQRRVNKR
ncbi:MAG: methyltransferase family protein [Candidatus Bathycorpusculaceae bacterium]